jgi:hypothetical protein
MTMAKGVAILGPKDDIGTNEGVCMMKKGMGSILGILMVMFIATSSQAATVFVDNFNLENGSSEFLNYTGFAHWNVTDGTVDLIGNGGTFDFYPGNGMYVDLDGSTKLAGILTTIATFTPGTYELQFDLAGSTRGDTNTVDISLGDWNTSLNLASNAKWTTYKCDFTTTSTGALVFHNLGGDNLGAILDNVKVSSVPLPAPILLFASGLLGLIGLGRKNKV